MNETQAPNNNLKDVYPKPYPAKIGQKYTFHKI